jgi:hypothetical protein
MALLQYFVLCRSRNQRRFVSVLSRTRVSLASKDTAFWAIAEMAWGKVTGVDDAEDGKNKKMDRKFDEINEEIPILGQITNLRQNIDTVFEGNRLGIA